jgi:uncharacterized membrane protein YbhN (UPF0104 family)
MKRSLKTYSAGTFLIILTLLTFAYVLPAGISMDNHLLMVLTLLYVILIYIPLAARILEFLGKKLLESFEEKN